MIRAFLSSEGITEYALLPFSACRVVRKHLLVEGERVKAVLVFLIPYYVNGTHGNLSRYCMARDYHRYVKELERRAKERFDFVLQVSSDHSPIDERHAASVAALGVLGENGLLLNRTYGSFCFVGEMFLSELPTGLSPVTPQAAESCLSCGACRRACPTGALVGGGACLSALSQQKKLSEEEGALLADCGTVWGCDRCQEVCPFNRDLPDTPISFFREDLIESLTEEGLESLVNSGELSERAYAWRGEAVLSRNLSLTRKKAQK